MSSASSATLGSAWLSLDLLAERLGCEKAFDSFGVLLDRLDDRACRAGTNGFLALPGRRASVEHGAPLPNIEREVVSAGRNQDWFVVVLCDPQLVETFALRPVQTAITASAAAIRSFTCSMITPAAKMSSARSTTTSTSAPAPTISA
jgi:hypothetical protein